MLSKNQKHVNSTNTTLISSNIYKFYIGHSWVETAWPQNRNPKIWVNDCYGSGTDQREREQVVTKSSRHVRGICFSFRLRDKRPWPSLSEGKSKDKPVVVALCRKNKQLSKEGFSRFCSEALGRGGNFGKNQKILPLLPGRWPLKWCAEKQELKGINWINWANVGGSSLQSWLEEWLKFFMAVTVTANQCRIWQPFGWFIVKIFNDTI